MLNLFGGGKASVQVTLDKQRCQPGETVQAQVSVQSEKDLGIREGRLVFNCREEHLYRYEEQHRDSQGHSHTDQKTTWQHWDYEAARMVMLPEGTIRGGSTQSFQYALTVPADGLPTCPEGKLVRVRWTVKATLDRKLAGDIENEVELLVFNAPPGLSTTGSYGQSNEPGEAALALDLPSREWALGDTIEGQLRVRPQKSFGVSEVRVELVCVELVPDGAVGPSGVAGILGSMLSNRRILTNQSEQVEKVQVASKVKLEAGNELAFPFRIAIPAPRPVSGRYHDSSVTWFLKGILARSLRSDTQVAQEILVYGGRP